MGAEATLWFGDWASRSGADHMALHHDLLTPLRGLLSAELAADPGKGAVRRTGAVISRAHRGLSPALALEEQVTWAAVLADAGLATDGGDDPDTAIDRMLERVLRAALEEPDRREGLRRWFAGAWQRFPERVRLAPGGQALFDVLVQGGGPDASASGHPSPLRFEGSTDIVLTLRHDGAYITAGDPEWPVEGILVPDTHPRVLDVSSDPVNWSRAQKLRVPRHGTAAVGVSHVPVYVRTARGVVYQLGAPGSSATVRYGMPGAVPIQDDLAVEDAADIPADAPAPTDSGWPPGAHEEGTEHDPAGSASAEQPERSDQYRLAQTAVLLDPPYGQTTTPLHGGGARDILIEILSPARDRRSRVHVLVGIGGSGKSRIALEAAHRLRESRRVWWVPANQIDISMREVAYQLGTPRSLVDQAFRDGEAHDLVWRALEAAAEPWLLVFDNADRPRQLGYMGRDVAEGTGWLREPRTSHGLVIVTSRSQSNWPSNSMVHLVRSLDEVDGAALLLERAPGAGSVDQARQLAVALGCLPLALHQAAAYVNSVAESPLPDPVVRDFETYTRAIWSRIDKAPGTSGSGLDHGLGLGLTSRVCGMSLELLTRMGLPEAASLLKLFACLALAPIPFDALMSSDSIELSPLFAGSSRFSKAKRAAALSGLADLGLIEVDVERPGTARPPDSAVPHVVPLLHLHPVIHGLLRADEDVRRRQVDYQRLNLQLLEDIAQDLQPDLPANWGLWANIAPHAIEVVRATLHGGMLAPDLGVAQSALVLARLTARYLIACGVLQTAAALVNPLIAECETFGFDEDSPDILQLKFERGRVALEAGQALDAEDEFARIAVVREQVLGAHHPDTLAARHALARSVLEQGRFAEAESLLRAIVQIEYAVHGTEHPDTLVTRHSLVRAAMALGHGSEVLDEARDILAVCLRQLGHDNPETQRIRQTLTRILLQTGRTDEAEREIDTALSNSTLAPDSPLTMALRHTRCLVLVTRGRIAEAAEELASLLEDQIRSQGPGHPETERTREMLQRVEEILST
ncbi:tetratricopeptide repeat protein [Streptomyces mirabilis]|uniref:tetratricopeptide repeat protein n=1 Tax=Streptomyces mirabilis TaxID=68239 RepID=UPI00332CDC05